MSAKTAVQPTVADVEAELHDVANLRETLEAERGQLMAAIAANLRGDTTAHEQRLASVNAKLQSLPVMVGTLQTAHDDAERTQILADYEQHTRAMFHAYSTLAQIDREIAEHQAAIATLNQQREAPNAAAQLASGKRSNLVRRLAGRFNLKQPFEAIGKRYSVPPYM